MRRRTVLLGTGVALSGTVAGCADSEATGDEAENGDGTGETDGTDTDESADDGNGADEGDDTEEDGDASETDADGEDDETGDIPEGVAIVEHELTEDEFWVWVTGTVVNNTGEELGTVEVEVTFYDADGEELTAETAGTSDLSDGEEWAFEVMEDGDDVAEYSVTITEAVPAERTPT